MKQTTSNQLYVRSDDRDRISKLAELEIRSIADQLTVVINEACERRGLDPATMKPSTRKAVKS